VSRRFLRPLWARDARFFGATFFVAAPFRTVALRCEDAAFFDTLTADFLFLFVLQVFIFEINFN
jgi:hypothetical protein